MHIQKFLIEKDVFCTGDLAVALFRLLIVCSIWFVKLCCLLELGC